jgi:predicted NAD-dependent protein-ADP-ribosyltransferase YbiA (DUF1768 family)
MRKERGGEMDTSMEGLEASDCVDTQSETVSQDNVQYFGSGAGIREFSNFYELDRPIVIDGEQFITTEHYYQSKYRCAKKSQPEFVFPHGILSTFEGGISHVVDKKEEIQKKRKFWGAKKNRRPMAGIVAKMAVNPNRAKRLGITLSRARDDPADLSLIKSLFERALYAKFSGDAELRKMLVDTGDTILVEFDRTAGRQTKVGKPPLFTGLFKDSHIHGKNLMGHLLMGVRKKLRMENDVRSFNVADT